jgi:hypothetical protein
MEDSNYGQFGDRRDVPYFSAHSPQRLKPEIILAALSARLEAVPFPVVVDRPALGGAGREAAGAEARLYCVSFTRRWKHRSSTEV